MTNRQAKTKTTNVKNLSKPGGIRELLIRGGDHSKKNENRIFTSQEKINSILFLMDFPNKKTLESKVKQISVFKPKFLKTQNLNLHQFDKQFVLKQKKSKEQNISVKIYRKNKQWENRFMNGSKSDNVVFNFPIFNNHQYYQISNDVMSDFQRQCWKSYWLRSNLTPYIRRVQNSMSLMRIKEAKWKSIRTLKEFMNLTLNFSILDPFSQNTTNSLFKIQNNTASSFYLPNRSKKADFLMERLPWYLNVQNSSQGLLQGNLNYLSEHNSKFQTLRNISEYDRVLYNRISDVIKNVKTNLNSNGQNNVQSFKQLSKGLRNTRYDQDQTTNSSSGNTSSAYQKKTPWQNLGVSLNQTFNITEINTFSIGNNGDFSIKPYGDLATLRALWALNQTNNFSFKETNQTKTLWATLKTREQNLNNKTKKFVVSTWNKIAPNFDITSAFLSKNQLSNMQFENFELENQNKHKITFTQSKIGQQNVTNFIKPENQKYFKGDFVVFGNNNENKTCFSKLKIVDRKINYAGFSKKNYENYFRHLKLKFKNKSNVQFSVLQSQPQKQVAHSLHFWWSKKTQRNAMQYANFALFPAFFTEPHTFSSFPLFLGVGKAEEGGAFFAKQKRGGACLGEAGGGVGKAVQSDQKSKYKTPLYSSPSEFSFTGKDSRTSRVREIEKTQEATFASFTPYSKIGQQTLVDFEQMKAVAPYLQKQTILTSFVFCSILFHLCALFSLIQIPEIRSFMKFYILVLYKFSNSYLTITFSIFNLLKNYKKQIFEMSNLFKTTPYSSIKYRISSLNLRDDFYPLSTLPFASQTSWGAACFFRFKGKGKGPSDMSLWLPKKGEEQAKKSTRLFSKIATKGRDGAIKEKKEQRVTPSLSTIKSIKLNYFTQLNSLFLVSKNQYFFTQQMQQFQILEMCFILPKLKMKQHNQKEKIKTSLSILYNNLSKYSSAFLFASENNKKEQARREPNIQKEFIRLSNVAFTDQLNYTNLASFLYQKWRGKLVYESKFNVLNTVQKVQSLLWLLILSTTKGSLEIVYNSGRLGSLFLFKLIDILESFMLIIYQFLEKPAELMVEWIAQLFLVEWSSDISSFIPESLSIYTWRSMNKFWRSSRVFGIFGFVIQRRLWCLLEIFMHSLTKQDSDLIARQRKGIIFWDIWAEILIQAAEKYNMNLPSLSTLKEEQEAFLERLLDDPNWMDSNLDVFSAPSAPFPQSKISLNQGLSSFYPEGAFFAKQKRGKACPSGEQSKKEAKPEKGGETKQIKTLEQPNKSSNSANANSSTKYSFNFIKFPKFNQFYSNQNSENNQFSLIEFTPFRNITQLTSILPEQPRSFNFSPELPQSKIGGQRSDFEKTESISSFPNTFQKISKLTLNFLNEKVNTNTSTAFMLQSNPDLVKWRQEFYGLANIMSYSNKTEKEMIQSKLGWNAWRRWSANQYFTNQGVETDLFIDVHPPKSFSHMSTFKYPQSGMAGSASQTLGLLTCQIFSGLFQKQVSKNILIVGSALSSSNKSAQGSGKSLLIQALAGETELKIISDNAYRYAHIQRGVAVGMKLLRDVFDALTLHTPCLFLMEDIHAIGERRPMLISDNEYAKAAEPSFASENEEVHEKNQLIYQLNRHSIVDYKRPYKGDFSLLIPTNHFCFDLFLGVSYPKIRKNSWGTSPKSPFSFSANLFKNSETSDISTQQSSNQGKNQLLETKKFGKKNASSSNYQSHLQLSSKQFFAPPATSPFTILGMKQQRQLKPQKIVEEQPWGGFSNDQMLLVSKVMYSIRVKIAVLADMAMNQLSVKLDMITDLLVIMDNVRSNRGFVVFATTHVPFVLDPALRRPGRLDETISIPLLPNLMNRYEILKTNLLHYSSTVDFLDYSFLLSSLNETDLLNFISRTKLLLFHNSNVSSPPCLSFAQTKAASFFALPAPPPFGGKGSALPAPPPFGGKGSKAKKSHPKDGNGEIKRVKDGEKKTKMYNNVSRSYLIDNIYQAMKLMVQTQTMDPHQMAYRAKKAYNHICRNGFVPHSFSPLVFPPPLVGGVGVPQSLIGGEKLLTNNIKVRPIPNGPSAIVSASYSQVSKFMIQSILLSDNSCFTLTIAAQEFYLKSSKAGTPASPEKPQETIFQNLYASSMNIENTLMHLLSGKVGEFFIFKNSFFPPSPPSPLGEFSPQSKIVFGEAGKDGEKEEASSPRPPARSPNQRLGDINDGGQRGPFSPPIFDWGTSMMEIKECDHFWRSATELVFSFLQKRYLHHQNLLATKLLYLNDRSPRREPPSPPASSILMPAKKYENYKRTERDFAPAAGTAKPTGTAEPQGTGGFIAKQKKSMVSIQDKIVLHQQQRFMKSLYEQPVFDLFRSEMVENRLTRFSSSFKELGYYDSFMRKPSSVNCYYKNRILTRQTFSLLNHWWNGQLAEHNVETTLNSDVDWRSMFSESFGDLVIDFPDADIHYNPKSRRWFLQSTYGGYWGTFEKTISYEIYYHFMICCFNKVYNYLDTEREILDYFAYTYLQKGSLQESIFVSTLSRFLPLSPNL